MCSTKRGLPFPRFLVCFECVFFSIADYGWLMVLLRLIDISPETNSFCMTGGDPISIFL